ncbi:cobalt-zinc-cadmium efflux system outer membrane protein [Rivibacter subsaxonicus]|uniref:Cobalt-zinc-cadmium efflux system outer membrane protein n=2 Tax=Rivibacter subsaxonicus TaxID=457575 RepID=A0A4Q7VWP2_9BURK|nr:cobalt-zinc-cadmium efflux system outer membrane protein [Rivibacter subsaxonicus]
MTSRPCNGQGPGRRLPLLALTLAASGALLLAPLASAQTDATATTLTLKQATEAAWLRHPEARGADARRDAAQAQRDVAASWIAEPLAVELSAKSDRLNRDNGNREYVAGVAIPLWLPGQRAHSQAVAEAERGAVDSRLSAAQWRVAGSVREAWWAVHRSRQDVTLAKARLANAEQLATDVARRTKAGDLSRADQHQADGAMAGAQAALAEAVAAEATAMQALRSVTGPVPNGRLAETPEAIPAETAADPSHPVLRELGDRAELARRTRELAGTQSRANPELNLATTRERGISGVPYDQSITVGVRIPFGSDGRSRAKVASAAADQIEAEQLLGIERERLAAEIDAARARVASAALVVAAADRRAALAHESRGFFEKSFRLGETDLPTRLRVDLEAVEAERQSARARIDQALALSQLRQALGLLPE